MREQSSMVEMPSRWRVTAYLSEETQKALERWALDENRSVSNLAATVLTNAAKEKGYLDESEQERDRDE